MDEKRDFMEPSNPRRQRELDAAIEKHFQELRRLLDEQWKDLEVLHDLRAAGHPAERPSDPNLLSLIQRWPTLPEDIQRQIIELAKQPEDRPGRKDQP